MRLICRSIIIGSALMISYASAAGASEYGSPHHSYKSVIADGPGPAPGVPVPAPMPIPEHGNWYIRADVGYAIHDDPDIFAGGVKYTHEDLSDGGTASVGVGYNFREHLRADITIDYRWDAVAHGFDPVTATDHRTEIETVVALTNLYYDIGSRDRLSPYVGVGVGVAHHDTGGRVVSQGGASVTTGESKVNTDLAVAAMVGFSYIIDQGFLIDAGYRFLYLGDAEAGPTLDGLSATEEIRDITAHEFRFGIRYEIY